MPEQERPQARLNLALGAGALIAAVTGGIFVGRMSLAAPPPSPVENVVEASPEQVVAPPVAPAAVEPKLLARADLIRLVTAAAADYAAGRTPGAPDDAIGRKFALRIAFGCKGPTATVQSQSAAPGASPKESRNDGETARRTERDVQPQQLLEWAVNLKTNALAVTVQPAVWTDWPLAPAIAKDEVDAIEGFWIPRPWSDSDACPAVANGATVAVDAEPPRQTVGLAQFYKAGGSRLPQRGDRPYRVVKKVSEEQAADLSRNYRLVLEGRVVGYADHRAVHCASLGVDERPICLVAVEFDKIAFEDPRTGESLGTWAN